MTGPRKVNNKNPMRHRVLKYLKEHPKEFQYIIGDFLAKHPEILKRINKKTNKKCLKINYQRQTG